MTRWYGKVGYIKQVQSAPSVWTNEETVREYYGDILRNSTQWTVNSDSTNDDLTINHQISIVADSFAWQNCHFMKWIEFMGVRWKIKSIENQPPRLKLTIGEVWNG